MNPLISIVILTFNRYNILSDTIKNIRKLDYPNIEIIIVDNCSNDKTPSLFINNNIDINYIRLEKNYGVGSWNNGINIAKGNFILLLDDDAYPEKESLKKAIEEFKDEKVGCVAFNIYDSKTKRQIKTKWQPDEEIVEKIGNWIVFIGCSAIFRSNIFKNNITKVPENYMCDLHELPMALDLYNNGYKIIFNKNIIAYHQTNNVHIYNSTRDKNTISNSLKFINHKLPYKLSFFHNFQNIIFYLSRSIRKKWFIDYLKIIYSTKYFTNKEKNFNYSYYYKLKKHGYFNFKLISKFKKKENFDHNS